MIVVMMAVMVVMITLMDLSIAAKSLYDAVSKHLQQLASLQGHRAFSSPLQFE